ncbi:hypothetical protein DNH61_01490 [Paenibacillus sambharensis]|uniref:Uncharacterized protein n=1 Tax=Paenibacillus sambharensis TaxID=1803190 RepID=A0A2W1LRH7_9BACL|nr:hypothetical protein [Paenibacillus sambharensis]PZD97572.1 hypothetical protein DNH61_01490 [Paenibacillus sambharensis]
MKLKKVVAAAVFSSVLVGAVSVSAYSGSYTFDIGYQVSGTTKHSLASKSTSTTVSAQSYYHSGNIHPDKDAYSVQLYKNWTTYYTISNLVADNVSVTKQFGTISAGDYTINVTKNGGKADKIIGSGTINQ